MRCFVICIAMVFTGLVGATSIQQSEPTSSSSEVWVVDPVHSMVLYRIHHAGAGRFWGRFNDVTGTVDWNRDDANAPAFDITVSAESVDSGNAKLDGHLKSPDFFNAREFPTLKFKSTGGERVGEGRWRVTGDLTMLGVTKPVTAEIEVTGVVGSPVVAKAGWEAIFEINRSDFGMDWGITRGALSDDVKLIVGIEGNIEPGA